MSFRFLHMVANLNSVFPMWYIFGVPQPRNGILFYPDLTLNISFVIVSIHLCHLHSEQLTQKFKQMIYYLKFSKLHIISKH